MHPYHPHTVFLSCIHTIHIQSFCHASIPSTVSCIHTIHSLSCIHTIHIQSFCHLPYSVFLSITVMLCIFAVHMCMQTCYKPVLFIFRWPVLHHLRAARCVWCVPVPCGLQPSGIHTTVQHNTGQVNASTGKGREIYMLKQKQNKHVK